MLLRRTHGLLLDRQLIVGILMIVAWVLAAKEALDLEWVLTIVTVILGGLAQFVITTFITGLVLGLFGLGAAAIGGPTGYYGKAD